MQDTTLYLSVSLLHFIQSVIHLNFPLKLFQHVLSPFSSPTISLVWHYFLLPGLPKLPSKRSPDHLSFLPTIILILQSSCPHWHNWWLMTPYVWPTTDLSVGVWVWNFNYGAMIFVPTYVKQIKEDHCFIL